ncbi:MAG: HAD family hydrolase [Chloroflexi bacterium]|nr:HAD family hydrolase [Chloroflexota bacterium]
MFTLLIDADDTLWESNIYYQRCSANLEDWLASLGVEREDVAPAIAHYEQQVLSEYGYSPQGYIEALARTTSTLAQRSGIRVTDELLAQARSFGAPMLHPPIVLLPNVQETLAQLAGQHRLILVTKGDEVLQQRKLERSGLSPYFQRVYVLQEKDVHSYQKIIQQEQAAPDATYMIGNSPKSDINPAVAAGLHAVFIPHDHTWTAEHEEIPTSPCVATLRRFSDLPQYLESIHP